MTRWVKDEWPGSKNARRRKAWIVFEDESGISLIPSVRSTWAPRGQTPVLTHTMHWDKVSMAGMLAYRPGTGQAKLFFQMRRGAYNDRAFVDLLRQLHRALPGQRVTLLWDNLGAHKSRHMRAYIARSRRWLWVEHLPAYAPDLNPVEGLWSVLKGTSLANLSATHTDEVVDAARRGQRGIRRRPALLHGLLGKAGLHL